MIQFQSTSPIKHLGREPAVVAHDFAKQINWSDRYLVQLLSSTPLEQIKTKTPFQQWNEAFVHKDISHAEIQGFIEGAETDCWILVSEIENHPLLIAHYKEMARTLESSLLPFYGKAKLYTGSIFISRGTATTPFHMDYGSTLLLQVRGNKRLLAFSPNDPEVVKPQSLEEFFNGNPNPLSLVYRPAFEAKALIVELEPGKGLYWPSTSPHCTETTSRDLSVSITLSFVSRAADQLRRASQFDRKLPAMRWVPRNIKCAAAASYESLKHLRGCDTSPWHESYKPFPINPPS